MRRKRAKRTQKQKICSDETNSRRSKKGPERLKGSFRRLRGEEEELGEGTNLATVVEKAGGDESWGACAKRGRVWRESCRGQKKESGDKSLRDKKGKLSSQVQKT